MTRDAPGGPTVRLFRNEREAVFAGRPNRFVVLAASEGETLRCHCPNPGRMEELLAPERPLILERRSAPGATGWTAAALRYGDAVVPLYSARANDAAAALVLPRLFPGALGVEREVTIGSSRFDFLVTSRDGTRHVVEVKACSLVERGTALFPDAPSGRAVRHLRELEDLSGKGYRSHVVFVILHGKPRLFAPNAHTDPAFAAELRRAARSVEVHAALIAADADGSARLVEESVPVDLGPGELAELNRGSYCVALELSEAARVEVGALGAVDFSPGRYVYCGSAQRNLAQRVARHARRTRKKVRWHLDYLTPYAARIDAYPIASWENLECRLARALLEAGGEPVPRFGSSDCLCPSHLYRFDADEASRRRVLEVVLEARHGWSFGELRKGR